MNTMEADYREPFYNKIFFCDIVGYSRHPALVQFAYQKRLNQVLSSVMTQLGTKCLNLNRVSCIVLTMIVHGSS
jgi:hypothetical protein